MRGFEDDCIWRSFVTKHKSLCYGLFSAWSLVPSTYE